MKFNRLSLFAVAAVGSFCFLLESLAAQEAGWTDLLDDELSQWEAWTAAPHPSITNLPDGYSRGNNPKKAPPIGLSDPFRVYTTERDADGQLCLKVSGQVYGGLTSKASYSNYHLTMQVKWGEGKYEPRLDKKRDSGVLYHCTGEHGAMWDIWKRSVELQIMEGDFGDLFLLGGPTANVRMGDDLVWNPKAEIQERKGDLVVRAIRSVDAESPHGDWTRIDLYVLGDASVHMINGQVVMALSDITLDGVALERGELQLQSEGAECYFRDIRIRPIDTLPKVVAQ